MGCCSYITSFSKYEGKSCIHSVADILTIPLWLAGGAKVYKVTLNGHGRVDSIRTKSPCRCLKVAAIITGVALTIFGTVTIVPFLTAVSIKLAVGICNNRVEHIWTTYMQRGDFDDRNFDDDDDPLVGNPPQPAPGRNKRVWERKDYNNLQDLNKDVKFGKPHLINKGILQIPQSIAVRKEVEKLTPREVTERFRNLWTGVNFKLKMDLQLNNDVKNWLSDQGCYYTPDATKGVSRTHGLLSRLEFDETNGYQPGTDARHSKEEVDELKAEGKILQKCMKNILFVLEEKAKEGNHEDVRNAIITLREAGRTCNPTLVRVARETELGLMGADSAEELILREVQLKKIACVEKIENDSGRTGARKAHTEDYIDEHGQVHQLEVPATEGQWHSVHTAMKITAASIGWDLEGAYADHSSLDRMTYEEHNVIKEVAPATYKKWFDAEFTLEVLIETIKEASEKDRMNNLCNKKNGFTRSNLIQHFLSLHAEAYAKAAINSGDLDDNEANNPDKNNDYDWDLNFIDTMFFDKKVIVEGEVLNGVKQPDMIEYTLNDQGAHYIAYLMNYTNSIPKPKRV